MAYNGSLWEAVLFHQDVNGTPYMHVGGIDVSVHSLVTSILDGGECFVNVTWLNLSFETSYDCCCNILHGFSQYLPATVVVRATGPLSLPPTSLTSHFPLIVLCCTIWVEWTMENCKAFPRPGKLGDINLNCHLSVPHMLSYDIKTADSLLAFIAQ
jgi:hypothetical protein